MDIKIISYIPRYVTTNSPHELITDFNPVEFVEDLWLIKELGFNAIRLIIPFGHTDSRGDFTEPNGLIKNNYMVNLKAIVNTAEAYNIQVGLVLFGWLDSNISGEQKYTQGEHQQHSSYLLQICHAFRGRCAYFSLENEVNNEPYGWWSASQRNRDMAIDWVARMAHIIRSCDDENRLITVGMANPKDWAYEDDYFRTPSWGGSSIYDIIDFISPHFYNAYMDGNNHGDVDNKIYYWRLKYNVTKRIFIEELPTNNPEDMKWFLEQMDRQNITEYGWWELYQRNNNGGHGILTLNREVRYPDLFHKEGEHEKGEFE